MVDFAQGVFTVPSGAGFANYTVGFRPSTVIFTHCQQTAPGVGSDAYFGLGWTDKALGGVGFAAASMDLAPLKVCASLSSGTSCILGIDTAGTVLFEAQLNTYNSTQFVLSWITASATAYEISYIAFNETYITNSKTQVLAEGTVGSNAFTGFGFRPKGLMMFDNQTIGPGPNIATIGYGWCDNSLGQQAIGFDVDSGSTTSYRYQSDGLYLVGYQGAINGQGTVTSLDADGFTQNNSAVVSNTVSMFTLAFTGNISTKSLNIDEPAGTGSSSVTGVGFAPKAVFFQGDVNHITNGAAGAALQHVGYTDTALNQSSVFFESDTGAAAAANSTYSNTQAVTNGNQNFTVTSLDSDGWTANWGATAAQSLDIATFSIGDAVAPGGSSNQGLLLLGVGT